MSKFKRVLKIILGMRIQLWNDNIDEANEILIEYKEYVEDLS